MPIDSQAQAKKAFAATFLLKCASEGLTLEQTAVRAEALAAQFAKQADGEGSTLAGRLMGSVPAGAALGLALPTFGGYVAGRLAGAAKNQMDTDDAETLHMRALANAWRRRTAESQSNAKVQKVVAQDPSKYIVL